MPNVPETQTPETHADCLEVSGLECVRGHRSLFRDLHFRLDAGSVLHVRGANGAGKTSLLRLLCGLSLPEAGEIRWNGAPLLKHRAHYHRALAYLGHRPALKDELTAAENLAVVGALSARSAGSAGAGTPTPWEALWQLGLENCLHLPCGVLSAGQRRRVALAGILLRPGGIWILDEPAAELDENALQFLTEMLGAQAVAGGLAIFTSHRDLTPPGATLRQIDLREFQ